MTDLELLKLAKAEVFRQTASVWHDRISSKSIVYAKDRPALMKKSEKYFILGLFCFALLLWGAMNVLRPDSYGSIRITVNGESYGTYSLSEDQTISIGETNICEIKDHQVRMTHADCPDQLCIRQGAIDAGGGMIVCLPNKVTIEGIKDDASADAVDSIA